MATQERMAQHAATWKKGPFSVRGADGLYLTNDGTWTPLVEQAAKHRLWATADKLATRHGGTVGVFRDGVFDTGAWA